MKVFILFLLAMGADAYRSLAVEWLFARPRKIKQPGYFDHCRGCTL